jgi:hypothetical protein
MAVYLKRYRQKWTFLTVVLCVQIALKLTYVNLWFQKFFRGYTPGSPFSRGGEGRRKEGKGIWEGEKGRDRKKDRGRGEGKGDGKGQERGRGGKGEKKKKGGEGSLALLGISWARHCV